MVIFAVLSLCPVNGDGTAYTENGMTARFKYGIVWNCHPSGMFDRLIDEVSRVIMISTNKDYPVVVFCKPTTTTSVNVFVMTWTLESETAISCHNYQSVFHFILNATFEN